MESTVVQRSVIGGDDPDDAKALYETGYNGTGFRVERTELDFSYRHHMSGDGTVSLRSSSFLGSMKGRLEPSPDYLVSWLHTGTASLKVRGQAIDWARGTPWLFPTGTPFDFDCRDYRQSMIAFDGTYLEQLAAEVEGTVAGPVRFEYAVTPGRRALCRWRRVIEEGADLVLRGDPTRLQMADVTRRSALALLATFLHERVLLPAEAILPRSARLRAAIDHLHLHAAEPVTPAEAAAAAGFTPRGLQQAFQRRLGITPTTYLRRIRLDRVRDELRAFGPHETSVGAVAAEWGFTHLGRFAVEYRLRFGESPRDTLRA